MEGLEDNQDSYTKIYGPRDFVRLKGKPVVIENSFFSANTSGDYYLRIYNGYNPNTIFTLTVVDKTDIKITEPADESIVEKKLVDITGNVKMTGKNLVVKMDILGLILEEEINNDGSFVFKDIPVSDGKNQFEINLYDEETFLARDTVTVYYYYPSEASSQVTPENGGNVMVDDMESPLYGATINIPAGAAKRSFRARIDESYAEHVPALEYGRKAVGPFIDFFPIGEVFEQSITLTLPVNLSMLPESKSIDDVIVIAESDYGWVEFPIEKRYDDSITIETNELVYTNFAPIIIEDLNVGVLNIFFSMLIQCTKSY